MFQKHGSIYYQENVPVEKRIYGYARMSKKEIEGRGTLSRHLLDLQLAGCTEVHWDISSRSNNNRKSLAFVLDAIARGDCKQLVITRLDRLTDNIKMMEEFIELVIKADISCRALYDSIDLKTVGGRTHARLLVAISKNEIETISLRYKKVWENIRRNGHAGKSLFGYCIKNHKYHLDRTPIISLIESKVTLSKASIARDLVNIFLRDRTFKGTIRIFYEKYGIAFSNHVGGKRYNSSSGLIMGYRNLKDWLAHPTLRGHTRYKKYAEIIQNTHKEHRLISEEEEELIDGILLKKKKMRGHCSNRHRYPLAGGLLKCGYCGATVYSRRAGKRNGKEQVGYYVCRGSSTGCPNPSITMESAENQVIDYFVGRAEKFANLALQPEPEEVDPQLVSLKDQLKSLESMARTRVIADAITQTKEEILVLENRGQNLQKQSNNDFAKFQDVFRRKEYWHGLTEEERREMYPKIIAKAILKDSKIIEINYH